MMKQYCCCKRRTNTSYTFIFLKWFLDVYMNESPFPKTAQEILSCKSLWFSSSVLQRLKFVKEWTYMCLGDFLICVKYIKCCSCPSAGKQYINNLETKLQYEMGPIGLVCNGFLNLNVLLFPRLFWREGFDFGFRGEALPQCCLFLHSWRPLYKEELKPSPELVVSVSRNFSSE